LKAEEKIVSLKRYLKDVLLPSDHHRNIDVNLLLEQQKSQFGKDTKILLNCGTSVPKA